jgi:glycosyltransferase involved in cell wall biosynthesis
MLHCLRSWRRIILELIDTRHSKLENSNECRVSDVEFSNSLLYDFLQMKHSIVILSAFATPLRSGAEACSEEVSALLQDDFDITIVTARMRKDLPREDMLGGVKVLRVGMGRSLDKWIFPLLGALEVRRRKPRIVHAVLESFAGLGLVLCRFLAPHSKRILTCQSTNTRLLLGPMHRSAHVITAISTPLLERAETFGREALLIPNGLHVRAFEKARHEVTRVPGRILFVGRLESMKGVDTLLKAFAEIAEQKLRSGDVSLRIVGDGSQRYYLQGLAEGLKLGGSITFAGRANPAEIATEYAAAEIFCGISRSEALGNVFLEAQAAGCAVVGTAVGGIPDIVTHAETGILVPPDDVPAAVQAVRTLLTDEGLRKHLTGGAIKNASAYDWSSIAKRYGEIYRSLVAK